MEYGFTSQDWETINTIVNNRLFSKSLKPTYYMAKDGTLYLIPAFDPTDYASIPPELWGPPLFLIPYGWYCQAVRLHDCAYGNRLLIVQTDGTTHLADLSRAESDGLLREAMESLKPNPTLEEKAQTEAIYDGVTVGGWHAFKEDRT